MVINTQELLHEVCNEKRFRKVLSSGVYEVRNALGDGLFTVSIQTVFAGQRYLTHAILDVGQADVPKEQNWYLARQSLHFLTPETYTNIAYPLQIVDRILMPAFSAVNVRNMFDDMVDVVLQLTTKWERSVSAN